MWGGCQMASFLTRARLVHGQRIEMISKPALNQELLCPPRYRRILEPRYPSHFHCTLGPESSTRQAGYSRLHLFQQEPSPPTVNAKRGNAALAFVAWDIVENRAPSSALWWRRDMGSGGCKCNANPLPDREGALGFLCNGRRTCRTARWYNGRALLMGDFQG